MTIPDRIERAIEERVASGRYKSRNEVLSKALSALEMWEEDTEAIRVAVARGIAQLDRGEGIPGDKVFARLKERNKSFRKKKSPK